MQAKTATKKMRPTVYGQANDQCVWSNAGVAKPMVCMNFFDCLGCAFDKKIQADVKARAGGGDVAGQPDPRTARLRLLINQRKCRHMLSGRVDYKLCSHGYDCLRCPYDQMIEEKGLQTTLRPPACETASGFSVARDYYYHPAHTWARVEYGGRIRIGIDDFAVRLLGPADEIRLPKLGETVTQGDPGARLHRGGHRAEVLSPVSGTVLAVNPAAKAKAASVNQTPYSQGWLMVVQPATLRKNLKNLLFGDESLAWIDDESTRLAQLVGRDTTYRLAATGGSAVADIYGSIEGLDWDRLVETFLT